MGQKVHPLGFRIGVNKKHNSIWYANSKQYSNLLKEDFIIRSFIEEKFANKGVSSTQIKRKTDQVEIELHTSRPGFIVGKAGSGIETLRQELQALLSNSEGKTKKLKINVLEVKHADRDARLIGEFISQQLEKRVAYKRVMRQAVQKVMSTDALGIKVQIAGRLNGAEIARAEWVREGRVPLQTLRANIDYASAKAHTTYGILGIKIWIFEGDS